MSSLITEIEIANVIDLTVASDTLTVRLDDGISIQGLIAGHHSLESQKSLGKWLESRKQV